MKMSKNLTKAIVLAACAVLLIVGSIAGTVAYLTSTDTIQNTFTYGKVAITLTEKDAATKAAGVNMNSYKLIPGKEYTKDATIKIADGSEACFLFVKIDNDFINLCDTNPLLGNWIKLGETDVYYYNGAIPDNNEVLVIGNFTVSESIENNSGEVTIQNAIVAYAVQRDGFNDAAAAWNATFGKSA